MLWEYLEWDTAAEGVSYFRWRRPKLSEAEEDLLSGVRALFSLVRVSRSREPSSQLLRNDSRTRYTLDELRMHPYFYDSKGRNAFDEILREAAADTYGEAFDFVRPFCFADLRPPSTAAPSTFLDVIHLPGPTPASIIFTPIHDFYDPYCDDFNQFGWINHRGIWSSHCDPERD